MSRSRRKTPIHGWTSVPSEKPAKQAWHRDMRRKVKVLLSCSDDDSRLPHYKEICNLWEMPKDGKCYLHPDFVKENPQILRK